MGTLTRLIGSVQLANLAWQYRSGYTGSSVFGQRRAGAVYYNLLKKESLNTSIVLMNKSRKVLQVSAVDITARFFIWPLAERLRREGFEVHLASSPGRYSQALQDEGAIFHPVDIPRELDPVRLWKAFWRLVALMKKHKFDIVHVHTPIASVVGRLAAKWARVPVVIYTVHGFFFHERMAPWKRWILIKIESFLGRYFTSFMFTVSGEDRASALQFKMLGADRIFWVKNGVDLQNFQSAPVLDLRREFGIPPEDRVICFIGRLVREKGIQDLLEALTIIRKKRSDFKLLIVGETLKSDRDHSASEIFRAYIQKNNLEKNVIFTGFRDDIPQILGSVDLFVLPSHREGMPQTILEAMAAGRPVVATNIRGCREEVIDGVTGALVRVVDPIDLAEKIHKILFNPQLAREMGLAGRKRVENEFDEDIVLSRQVEIYRDFVAREKSIFS